MTYRFKGTVKKLTSIANEAKTNPTLKTHLDNFSEYWLEGFSPLVGRDVPSKKPRPPDGHRHVHLHPGYFSSDEACKKIRWDKWSTTHYDSCEDAQDIPYKEHPTSDTLLFYLVDENRTAYVFHYLADGAHAFLESANYGELVNTSIKLIESSGECIMGWESHHELFELKWINDNND